MSFTIKVKRTTHVDLSKVQLSLRGPKKVKVGLVAGEADSDNIMKGIYNEFGTKGSGKGFKTPRGGGFGGPIPERPFLRNAMRDNRAKYKNDMKANGRKLLLGQTSLQTVLSMLGIMAEGDVQASLTSLSSPPNSPVTIAIKGSANPLIDTGELKNSIKYKVGDF